MPINTTDPDIQPSPAEEYDDEVEVKCSAVGDGIDARVRRFRRGVDTKYGPKTVLSFDTVKLAASDGADLPTANAATVHTIWATPGLEREFDAKSVAEGDHVQVALVELVDTGKGNPFKKFGVKVVARDQPAPPADPNATPKASAEGF